MSAPGTVACPENVSDETLAIWRDGFLGVAGERLQAHIPTCASCQQRMTALESLGAALRRQRVPEPDPALWRRIETLMASGSARVGNSTHRFTASALWGAIGAAAAVLLIIAGFLSLFSTAHLPGAVSTTPTLTTPTPTAPQPTSSPTSALDWQAGSVPPFYASQQQRPSIAVAPSDGQIAYTCVLTPVTGGTRPAIWRTDDRAATWARVGALPITRNDLVECTLLLDEGEPAIAVASVSYGAFYAGAPDHIDHFATYDHGVNWQPVTDADGTSYQKLITYQKIKFALRDTAPPGKPDDIRLATSVDNMASWQRIDKPLISRGLLVTDFWLDSASGALIAMVGNVNSGNFPLQFWRSNDRGASWTMIADQQANLGMAGGGFARPTGSWSLCAITPADLPPLTVRCTTDGGQTWSRFQRSIRTIPGSALWQLMFKRDDGSFLVGIEDTAGVMTILRLDPAAGKWTTLGQILATPLSYAPTASGGAGVLWAIPSGGSSGAWQTDLQTATIPG
jgi:photosystem II stability/assembly factor-like uncharacterized protein